MARPHSKRRHRDSGGQGDLRRGIRRAWNGGDLFLLTMHPHITGHRSRLPVQERLIRHMKAKDECRFATHAQVAAWCRDNA